MIIIFEYSNFAKKMFQNLYNAYNEFLSQKEAKCSLVLLYNKVRTYVMLLCEIMVI